MTRCDTVGPSGDRNRERRPWERKTRMPLISTATAEVHRARRRHQRELAERNRYRRLVQAIDQAIETCEETHLQHIKECPADLKERAADLLRRADKVVCRTRDAEAIALVQTQVARPVRKVTEVMDSMWAVQEVLFDLMLPWRNQLPEDVEVPGMPLTTWRYDSAA